MGLVITVGALPPRGTVVSTFLVVAAVTAVALVVALGLWRLAVRRGWLEPQGMFLVCTALAAVIAMSGATAWLLWVDAPRGPGEALKSGALVAGAVLALYGLWLNHRRHQVEEERKDTERKRYDLEVRRSEHDRERGAAERFARAIELLGDEADQVRVGAMHSLVGLARGWPDFTQMVLDVLCAYLRRPFDHSALPRSAGAGRDWSDPDQVERADRERQVRFTAQRLLQELLSRGTDQDADGRSLDLTNAVLDGFVLRDVRLGSLLADGSRWFGVNAIERVRISGELLLRKAIVGGRLSLHDDSVRSVVLDGAEFDRLDLTGLTVVELTAVHTDVVHELVADRLTCTGPVRWRLDVKGRTSFRDATFLDALEFSGTFKGLLDFDGGRFGDPTRFDDVTVHGGLRFRVAEVPTGFAPARFFVMSDLSDQEVLLPGGLELRDLGNGLGRVQCAAWR